MNDLKSVSDHFVANHIAELPKSGIRAFFDLVNNMKDVISLGVGEPDFTTPWGIRESGIFSLEHGHTSYTSNLGMPSLRKAITNYVEKRYNASYNPTNECIVTVGVSEAVDLAMRAVINPGDEVIYSEPCYVSYPAEIKMAHGVPVAVPTSVENDFALEPAKVAAAITPKTKAILLNFPCNPTGADMPEKDLKAIAKLAQEHDLLVFTDEIYSELDFTGKHISIASLPGMKERTIFLHGFSKAFAMTGWRIGYACGPAAIIDAMMKIHQYAIMCAPTVAQEAALEALKRGENEMEKMRDSYLERRNFFVESLNKIGLKCRLPLGAFYAFPSIAASKLNCNVFAENLLKAQKVAVVPGTAFGISGEGFVRCCYATSRNELKEAVIRMEKFIDSIA